MIVISAQRIESIATALGIDILGYTSVEPLSSHKSHLDRWQSDGFAAEMQYMNRESEIFLDPLRFLPSAKTVLLFGIPYKTGPAPIFQKGFGRVARYAWGSDYHKVIPLLLRRFIAGVEGDLFDQEKIEFKIFTDAVPLLERGFAERAGVGFIGKNTMLIRPKVGSYLFLAEILWNIRIEGDLARAESKASCGSCTSCISKCPTGALVEPKRLDARRCISYLTIERRGILSEWERRAIGEWVFGCDICQDVCPFNHNARKKTLTICSNEFEPDKGAGALLDLKFVLQLRTDDLFRKHFFGTALMRAKRTGILRNSCVVAGNTLSECLTKSLLEVLQSDPEPIVRGHALWALSKYSLVGILSAAEKAQMEKLAFSDQSDVVRQELFHLLEEPSRGQGGLE